MSKLSVTSTAALAGLFLFILAAPAPAQFGVASVPAFNSQMHGIPASYWIAQVSGPATPASWRVLSIVGPPGLTVTTSGGNVVSSGGGPSPFEPWASLNTFSAVTTLDPPPRVDSWTIFTEAVGPGAPSVASSLLIVSHGPPIVLPFFPIGGGRPANGASFNLRCNPKVLRLDHDGTPGFITLDLGPGSPPPSGSAMWNVAAVVNPLPSPFPAPATATAFPPPGAPPLPFTPGVSTTVVTCGPEDVRSDPHTKHTVVIDVSDPGTFRTETEKCCVICVHDRRFAFGFFDAIEALPLFISEEPEPGDPVLSDGTMLSLIGPLLNAQEAFAELDVGASESFLREYRRQVKSLRKAGALEKGRARLLDRLGRQLLAALEEEFDDDDDSDSGSDSDSDSG